MLGCQGEQVHSVGRFDDIGDPVQNVVYARGEL